MSEHLQCDKKASRKRTKRTKNTTMRSVLSIMTLTTNYQRSSKKNAKQGEGWKKPPEETLLLNVDVDYRSERGDGDTGGVIKDSTGSITLQNF